MSSLLPIFITVTGFTFWLWARGGKIAKWPQEADELEQVLYSPAVSPLLRFAGGIMITYGLYLSYSVSWLLVAVNFFIGAFLGKILYNLFIKRFIE